MKRRLSLHLTTVTVTVLLILPGLLRTAGITDIVSTNRHYLYLILLYILITAISLVSVAKFTPTRPGSESVPLASRKQLKQVSGDIGVVCLLVLFTTGLGYIWPNIDYRFGEGGTQSVTGILYVAAVFGAVAEESFFRRWLIDAYSGITERPAILLASSVLFAALHIHQGPMAFLFALAAGLAYGSAYLWRGRFYVPALAHMIHNLLALLLITAQ